MASRAGTHPRPATGLAFHVEAGVRVMPQLLLGFDLSGLTASGNTPGGLYADSTILGYDAVAKLFPFVHGFFLRGGGGLSTLTSVPACTAGFSYLVTNLLLGAGWAFPVAPPLHLTLGVDWVHPFLGCGTGLRAPAGMTGCTPLASSASSLPSASSPRPSRLRRRRRAATPFSPSSGSAEGLRRAPGRTVKRRVDGPRLASISLRR